MLQAFHEDEDDLFSPSPNSNLASLFGNPPMGHNSSLTYVAPKQPKNISNIDQTNETETKPQSITLCAKPIIFYKIVQNSYKVIGKYGLALIGNSKQTAYELIVYKDKQNIVKRIVLTHNFNFICQENGYISFSDENKQFWTAKFTNTDDLNSFLSELQTRNFKIVNHSTTNKDAEIQKQNVLPSKSDNQTTEETASDAKTKADILSRIVKMGQKTFPTSQKELSDTESDASDNLSNREQIKTINGTNLDLTTSKSNKVDCNVQQNCLPSNSQMIPVQTLYYPQNELTNQNNMHVFFAENRTHNSEIRMNINHLSSKLDSVLLDLQKLKLNENEILRHKIEQLEAKMLLLDQKASQQNENHNESCLNKTLEKIENKIVELIQTNNNLQEEIKMSQNKSITNDIQKENVPNKVAGIIKQSMNDMYQNICKNFDKDMYTKDELKEEIAKIIKDETLQLLLKIKEPFQLSTED